MLALGVDEGVLEAGRMSQRLLEETAAACSGAVVYGFDSIHQVFKQFSLPPSQQISAALESGVDIHLFVTVLFSTLRGHKKFGTNLNKQGRY
jgi:hypothetical protein